MQFHHMATPKVICTGVVLGLLPLAAGNQAGGIILAWQNAQMIQLVRHVISDVLGGPVNRTHKGDLLPVKAIVYIAEDDTALGPFPLRQARSTLESYQDAGAELIIEGSTS